MYDNETIGNYCKLSNLKDNYRISFAAKQILSSVCKNSYGFIKSLVLSDISLKAQILWRSNYFMISTFT